MRDDAVRVAFGHDGVPRLGDRLPRDVQAVKLIALGKEGRLGRIDVLGGVLVGQFREDPAANRDRTVLGIAYREQHASLETVVTAARASRSCQQSDAFQFLRLEARAGAAPGQPVPFIGRIADMKFSNALLRDAALVKVSPRGFGIRRVQQVMMKFAFGPGRDLKQPLLRLGR
jgi:hypothetical protein